MLGVVYDVTRDQLYSAAKGQGAWLGTREIRALETPVSDASAMSMPSMSRGRAD